MISDWIENRVKVIPAGVDVKPSLILQFLVVSLQSFSQFLYNILITAIYTAFRKPDHAFIMLVSDTIFS